MKDKEPKRRGPKEKPIPQKSPSEYTAAERMRLARQNAGKTLSEAARELEYSSLHLSLSRQAYFLLAKSWRDNTSDYLIEAWS